jgi:phenylacetate-coenzyme A ligase PaaK-like adenylate-forming protein
MRKALEESWGCRVFEHYGSTELGLGGAVQCEAFGGLHVREADLLFEVVDPSTGRPVLDGVEGELVATTLTREGMPLIRYRTGDLVRMSVDPCPCGSVLRCLERVTGRREDPAILAAGHRLTIADLDEIVYGYGSVLGFTAGLGHGPVGDRLTVVVEVRDDSPLDLAAELTRRLSSLPAIRLGAVEVVVEAAYHAAPVPLTAKQRIVAA